MSRRRVSEGIRPSLGDRQGPTVVDDAHRVVMVVLGDFSRRGDGVGGLGRRLSADLRVGVHDEVRVLVNLCVLPMDFAHVGWVARGQGDIVR